MLSSLCRHRLSSLPRLRHAPASTRTFITRLKVSETPTSAPKLAPPGIRNQILFFVFGSTVLFAYAAERTNIETDIWAKRLTHSIRWTSITNVDLRRIQQVEFVKNLRSHFAYIQNQANDIPRLLRPWIAGAYLAVAQPYADASDGKRLCWKLCLINTGIWIAWHVQKLTPIMWRSFTHTPLSGLSYTMATSVFSHSTFFHLLLNCLALESFGSSASVFLSTSQQAAAPEQLESTARYHFTAFFLSAGVFSSLVSHIVNAKFRYPRIVSQLASPTHAPKTTDTWAAAVAASARPAAAAAPLVATPKILPSLGASGAIYSCVTMTALAYPEGQIALSIPPSYPINIQWGVGGMVLLDVIGLARGWRLFDHCAHLGGAAFGVAYYNYGPAFWTGMRSMVAPQKAES